MIKTMYIEQADQTIGFVIVRKNKKKPASKRKDLS